MGDEIIPASRIDVNGAILGWYVRLFHFSTHHVAIIPYTTSEHDMIDPVLLDADIAFALTPPLSRREIALHSPAMYNITDALSTREHNLSFTDVK